MALVVIGVHQRRDALVVIGRYQAVQVTQLHDFTDGLVACNGPFTELYLLS